MISEDLIREAVQEYAQALDEQLPEPETHRFSARFVRKMKSRFTQAEHGRGYLALRRAACVLLVLVLCGGALLAVPSVQASVANWFVYHWPDGSVTYRPNGDTTTAQAGEYAIGWVPEGFALDDCYEVGQTVRYLTEDRDMILLSWSSKADHGTGVGGWSDEVYTATVQGRPADVYLKTEALLECTVIWTNREESIIFTLVANCDDETALKIAESVYPVVS